MKLQKTSPIREEVALSGEDFGDDIGRGRGGRGGRGRGPARGRGRGPRGRGGRGPGPRGRGRPPHLRDDEDLEEVEEELAGRKERLARRKLRKKQRGQRRGLRSQQKLTRLRRKAKTSRPGRSKGSRGGRSGGRPGRTHPGLASRGAQAALNAPDAIEELPVADEWENEAQDEWDDTADEWDDTADAWEDEADEDLDEWDDDLDELEEEYLEGTYAELGAAIELGRIRRGDARRIFSKVKANIAKKRQRLQARRRHQPAAPSAPAGTWGPVASLNSNIRIQAGNGHRAAVMELRPGLYLVADVKDQAVLPSAEGGIAGVLPALMAKGAANALRTVIQKRRESGGRRRLWDRERNNPVLNPPSHPGLSPQPLQLAGPVATDIGECCCWVRKEDQ